MYGTNKSREKRICEARNPINIAIVTQPALRSISMSLVLFECRIASAFNANGIA